MSDNSDKGGKRPGSDAGRVPVAREKLPTLTNAKELEAALKKSMEMLPSSAPSPKIASTPSKPPPPLVLGEFTDLDKGWGDDDLEDDDPAPAVNAPAGAGATGLRPGGRRSSKMRAAATPVTKPNDVPTAPPPVAAPPPAAAMPTPPPGAPAAPLRNVAPQLAPPPALETFDLLDDTAQELGLGPPPLPPKVPEPPPTKPGGMDLTDEEPDPGRKSFPSTRSLVSGLDEDALVSSLFDEDSPQVEAETRRTADPTPAHPAKPPRPPVAQPPRPPAAAAPAAAAAPVTAPAPPAAQAAIATETSASRAATRHAAPPDKPADKPADAARDMRDRFALGDYTGALESAESILAKDGADQEALDMAQNCRDNLEQMYKAKLGALDRVPIVMVPSGELRWLSIDHRAGFVLSNIDGVSSLEMIIDVSGMAPLDALRILCELAQQRIISFR